MCLPTEDEIREDASRMRIHRGNRAPSEKEGSIHASRISSTWADCTTVQLCRLIWYADRGNRAPSEKEGLTMRDEDDNARLGGPLNCEE